MYSLLFSLFGSDVLEKLFMAGTHVPLYNKAVRAFFMFAGFLFAAAVMMAIAGSYFWLSSIFMTGEALILTAFITLGFSTLICGIAYGFVRYKNYKLMQASNKTLDVVGDILDVVEGFIEQPVNDNPKTAAAVAVAAGYLAGENLL